MKQEDKNKQNVNKPNDVNDKSVGNKLLSFNKAESTKSIFFFFELFDDFFS